jgi:hypothetical protein
MYSSAFSFLEGRKVVKASYESNQTSLLFENGGVLNLFFRIENNLEIKDAVFQGVRLLKCDVIRFEFDVFDLNFEFNTEFFSVYDELAVYRNDEETKFIVITKLDIFMDSK